MAHEILVTNGNGGPPWLKAIVQLGVPAALCLFLVYWTVVRSDADHQILQARTLEIAQANEKTQGMVAAHIDAAGRVNAEILFILRVQCVQGARLAGTDPRDCVPPRDLK